MSARDIQLRVLLGEIRAGSDIESAAIVSEIPLAEAYRHLMAERRGEYGDVIQIQPLLVIQGDDLVRPAPIAANDPAPSTSASDLRGHTERMEVSMKFETIPMAAACAQYSSGETSSNARWEELRDSYTAALIAEGSYCGANIDQHLPDDLPIGPERNAAVDTISAAVWTEAERLQEIRCAFEDELLTTPSPHAAAFALKVLICRGNGRDLNGLDEMLEAEAREFADAGPPPCDFSPIAREPGAAFKRLVEAHAKAVATSRLFEGLEYDPVREAFHAAVSKIPHAGTSANFVDLRGNKIVLSTEDESMVAIARRLVVNHPASAENEEWLLALRQLVDADDSRRAERDRVAADFGVAYLRAKEADLGSAEYAAMFAVIEHPVEHLGELIAKIAFISDQNAMDEEGVLDAIGVDVRRLAVASSFGAAVVETG